MAQSSQEVRNLLNKFQMFSKFSGMCCFCYPSDKFMTSITGQFFAAFHSTSLVLMLIKTVQSLGSKLKRKASVVYLLGLTVIELKILLLLIAVIWINFLFRKKIFKALKMLEQFDEVNTHSSSFISFITTLHIPEQFSFKVAQVHKFMADSLLVLQSLLVPSVYLWWTYLEGSLFPIHHFFNYDCWDWSIHDTRVPFEAKNWLRTSKLEVGVTQTVNQIKFAN